MEYKTFSESRCIAPRSPLVADRNLCYYRTYDLRVGKLHLTLTPPKDESRGEWVRIHTGMNKAKCIAKIHA